MQYPAAGVTVRVQTPSDTSYATSPTSVFTVPSSSVATVTVPAAHAPAEDRSMAAIAIILLIMCRFIFSK